MLKPPDIEVVRGASEWRGEMEMNVRNAKSFAHSKFAYAEFALNQKLLSES